MRRAWWAAVLAAMLSAALPAAAWAQQQGAPAGGAAIGEVIVATVVGLVGTALVLGPVLLYRMDRLPGLGRLADGIGRLVGLPGWAAFPLAIQGGAGSSSSVPWRRDRARPRPAPRRRAAAGRRARTGRPRSSCCRAR